MTSPKYDVHVQFLKDTYFCSTCVVKCSKTVPTENRIEMKTKEIHFILFYFHFNYVVEHPDATASVRDIQYCGNGDFF